MDDDEGLMPDQIDRLLRELEGLGRPPTVDEMAQLMRALGKKTARRVMNEAFPGIFTEENGASDE